MNSGDKYGRLTAVEYTGEVRHGNKIWRFTCDCGQICEKSASHVKRGATRSCGCYRREVTSGVVTHGNTVGGSTPEYRAWNQMKNRCENPKVVHYSEYGGRGITVCERWKNSFQNFLSDMGSRPRGGTLDRINNNGNYNICIFRIVSI